MHKLTRALNIEQGEGVQVSLILLQSFFIGTFMATFDVAANALFFTSFNGSDLGQAYAFSAVLGMIFTYIYIKLQSVISFTKLAISNLIFIALLSILMRVGFIYTDSKWLIYTAFLLQGPLNTLAIVGFWGLMGRIFNLRQGKRLFGLVDSGQILGMIIILFSVPLIRAILPNTEDLIMISAFGISLSVIMQFVISNKYKDQILTKKQTKETTEQNSSISILKMMKNPYLAMMILFVLMAMLAQFFAHYSFLVTANIKYPTAGEFASFLAVFMGVLMVFTFAFKTFVFSKLMVMYGLKVNLLILPFLLIFFTLLASLSGVIFGYEEESAGFQMFFLFIAISKLFAQSLRMAIEVPAFKLLYQPLNSNIKYDVQAKIDGTINEFSALIGGLVLMSLSLIPFVTLIGYTFVLVLIIVIYIFVAFKLYQRYRETLHQTLDNFKGKLSNLSISNAFNHLINSTFNNNNPHKTLSVLKVCKEIEPVFFRKTLKTAFNHQSKKLQNFAVQNVIELGISQYKNELNKIAVENNNTLNKELLHQLNTENITSDTKLIAKYLRSKNPIDKILLLNQIATDKTPNISVIAELLKDPNFKVRRSAIITVGEIKEKTLIPAIIENIHLSNYRTVVSEVLLSFESEMFEMLDLAFYKSNFDSQTLVHIISIFEKTNNKKAIPFLLKKLSYPDQKVVDKTLSALKSFEFKANSSEMVKVQQSIENGIGVALWNMVALEEAKAHELPPFLIRTLEQETFSSLNFIYTLLSLIYDSKSISNIRENIESGTSEGVGFAIELLDLFVAEELKPKLFPLLDDLDIDEKIYRLELFYPIQRLEKNELILQIINRDFNYINNWTKACALYSLIIDEDDTQIIDDYIAQLFNPDPLLYQTAAWLIYKNNSPLYTKISERLSTEKKAILNEFLPLKKEDKDILLVEKGLFLASNQWLKDINSKIMASICSSLETYTITANNTISNVVAEFPLAIIKKGSIIFNDIKAEPGDIISDLVLDNTEQAFVKENTELYVLERDKFYDLLYLHDDFLTLVLKLIDNYYSQESVN